MNLQKMVNRSGGWWGARPGLKGVEFLEALGPEAVQGLQGCSL